MAVLDDGLRSFDLTLSDAARQVIDDQARLLLAWNPHINLTADPDTGRDRPDARRSTRSPRCPSCVRRVLDAPSVLDLGSGGGYPGLPLAMSLPAGSLTLLDSVAKKVRFLDVLAGVAATSPGGLSPTRCSSRR